MTFLKKLGQILASIAGVAAGIGPIVLPFLGSGKAASVATVGINDLTSIGQVVVQAEALMQTPGSGAAKLTAATPLVAQIIQTSELVVGKKIANEALFLQGSAKVTSGVADILNSLDANAAQSTTGGVAPPAIATAVAAVPNS